MDSYFSNMTSFTLFKPHSIESKFASMRTSTEAEALVAAMFSFSARFQPTDMAPDRPLDCPAPSYFAHIASTRLEKALDQCGTTRPPFWLLQASVLVTFYQLTQSVRSKSWRTLGNCIRLAYDMNLHLTDANTDGSPDAYQQDIDIERWSILEERRRAWWAIWEMDVFASTIRRLPMGIDWSQNFAFLPVPDGCWFSNVHQASCYLASDPNMRWKLLSKSGNTGARAWFIITNSLMRNAQLIVYNRGSTTDTASEASQADLTIIANCLFCTAKSLPPDLAYRGETLDFRTKFSPKDISYHQYHSDKYAIHLMTQLVRFMVHHHKICALAPWLTKSKADDGMSSGDSHISLWSNYMKASEEIVTMVRVSSYEHHKYVNPFLANTLWFAAAAQIACTVFGPSSSNKMLAESNYELLALAIDQFITFWSSMDMLKPRLARIEASLKTLMAKENGQEDMRRENADSVARPSLADPAIAQYQGSAPDHQPLSEAVTAAMDPNTLLFAPILYDNPDPWGMAERQIFLEDPGQFFPYGVDEFWMSKMSQI